MQWISGCLSERKLRYTEAIGVFNGLIVDTADCSDLARSDTSHKLF
jgi:hypothetical protein